MEIKYQVHYLKTVVRNEIPSLTKATKNLIKKVIEERLMRDPIRFGKPLQYSFRGHRRLRVGDYRIIYRIESETVIVVAIKHRKDVYDG